MKKKNMAVALLFTLTLVMTACAGNAGTNGTGGGDKTDKAAGQPQQAAKAEAAPKTNAWAESAGLYKTETAQELYDKAKQEGKVTVYSTSSRINDVKKTFEKQYPGVTLEIFDLKSNEILDKIIREQGAGIFNADLILTKEVGGAYQTELVDKGMLFRYIPDDIASHMYEPWKSKAEAYVPYLEARTIFYNTEQNKSQPVTNWWELTDPSWKGRVLVTDPMTSSDQMDWFASFVVNSDEMAKAYKEKYGKDVELHGTENAGYEFLQRLIKNIVIVKASADGQDAVGKAGQTKPAPVYIGVTGDIRKMEERKLQATIAWDMKPKLSLVNEAFAFIGNKAPHPNAAKLLVRWMAGEADGKGAGLDPFQLEGTWLVRSDVKNMNDKTASEMSFWPYDGEAYYKVHQDVVNFWIKNQ